MLEAIKSFIKSIAVQLNVQPLIVAIVGAVLCVAVLVIVIAIIVKCTKKKKAKKAQIVKESTANIERPQQVEEVVKEEIVAEAEKAVTEEEKPVTEEKSAKKEPVKEDAKNPKTASNKKSANGKWQVEQKGEGEYLSKLFANNGEVMLSSEIYTTEDGARNGIATIIKGVDSGNFIIYQDKNNNYYYKLKSSNNRLLCVGEVYKAKDQCLKAVETVKRIAKTSTVLSTLFEGAKYAEYIPAELSIGEVKKGLRGKWKIEQNEDGKYSAKLYASNGQIMLATEEVALEKSAKNAIASVIKNATEGNFIIDNDKFGRYYYKLRNAQKSVICIGSAYDTLESCISAIESVRRFAITAVQPGKQTEGK